MTKQRLTALDIHCICNELKSTIIGTSIQNIYNITKKLFSFKLASNKIRAELLFELGIRIHLTDYDRNKTLSPNDFTLKLRKLLKNSTIIDAKQLGFDRVIQIVLNSQHSIIFELFSNGNLIVLDENNKIVLAQKFVTNRPNYNIELKNFYPFERYANINLSNDEIVSKYNAITNKEGYTLCKFMSHLSNCFTSPLVQTFILNESDNKNYTIDDVIAIYNEIIAQWNNKEQYKGYYYHETSLQDSPASTFSPIPIPQLSNNYCQVFNTFSKAVDEFFSNIEIAKFNHKAAAKEREAQAKYNNIKNDQIKRKQALQEQCKNLQYQAEYLEEHLTELEICVKMVNALINTKAQWDEIEAQLEEQKKKKHKYALCIVKIDWSKQKFLFTNHEANVDKKLNDHDVTKVWVDYTITAYNNIDKYYESAKSAYDKYLRTVKASEEVLSKSYKDLINIKKRSEYNLGANEIQLINKTYWFEKFYWFKSSDGFLVIAGRDAMQNDILYNKYLDKDDIFVHANIHGASTVIIKVLTSDPVPERTINEAGSYAVSLSNAWKNKIVASAFWVYSNQVSKTPETGEYITIGSFVIRGKKNYIIVHKLELGISLLFIKDIEDINMECVNTVEDINDEYFNNLNIKHNNTSENSIDNLDTIKKKSMSNNTSFSCDALHNNSTYPNDQDDNKNDSASNITYYDLKLNNKLICSSNSTKINELDNVNTTNKNSVVKFGGAQIISPPELAQRVEFDSHIELITVDPDTTVHSDNFDADIQLIDEKVLVKNKQKKPKQLEIFEKKRKDSVDELPPPDLYKDIASPKLLLSHSYNIDSDTSSCDTDDQVNESTKSYKNIDLSSLNKELKNNFETTAPTSNENNDIDDKKHFTSTTTTQYNTPDDRIKMKHRSSLILSDKITTEVPKDSIDGGPLPLHYVSVEEIPSAKELLSNSKLSCSVNEENKPNQISKQKQRKLKKIKKKYADQSDSDHEYSNAILGIEKVNLVSTKKSENKIDQLLKLQRIKKEDEQKKHNDKIRISQPVSEEKKKIELENIANQLTMDLCKIQSDYTDNDIIIGLIPMLAPYSVIEKNFFSSKLVPGNMKKSQIANALLKAFSIKALGNDKYKNNIKYIKTIKENRLMLQIVSNSTIILDSLTKDKKIMKIIKQDSTKKKKQKK